MDVWTRLRRYPLLGFALIAFGITWLCQGAAIWIASARGFALSNEESFLRLTRLFSGAVSGAELLATLLFLLVPGPLIAGLVMTRAAGGAHGQRDLLRRIVRWRVAPRWYLTVFALPLATAAMALIAALISGWRFSDMSPLLPLSLLVPYFLFVTVFTGLWQEPGWRGFVLPILQRRLTAENASWVVGIIWGLWHVPFVFYYNLAAGAPAVMLLPLLAGLTVGIVGWSICITWVYNSTNSVFLVILLHGWYNTVNTFLVLPTQNVMAQTLNSLLPWVIAIVLLRVYGKENLARLPRPTLLVADERPDFTAPERPSPRPVA